MNPHTHCLRSLCAFLAALVLAACLACPALADAPLVRDEYGLFDADTLAQLESTPRTLPPAMTATSISSRWTASATPTSAPTPRTIMCRTTLAPAAEKAASCS